MTGVLLSYRRADSAASTGRLRDRLVDALGHDHVFMDVDDVMSGTNFRILVNEEIARCDVVCVIIGPGWASASDEHGIRLFQADDPVRLEVLAALGAARCTTIPVLVDGAQLPRAEDLPDGLRPLLHQSGTSLRSDSYDEDVSELLAAIKARLQPRIRLLAVVRRLWQEASWMRKAVASLVAVLGAGMLCVGIYDRFFKQDPKPDVNMSGDLNVAVTEFGTVKDDGSVTVTDESKALAESVYELLDSELSEFPEMDFEVLAPSVAGRLPGDTAERRSESARAIHEETGADIVVYALVDERSGGTLLQPEFHIVDPAVVGDAAELVGYYRFGSAITAEAIIENNPLARKKIRTELFERAGGLLDMVEGLALFALHEYAEAADTFDGIAANGSVPQDSGLEIVYLFAGNAAGRLDDFARAEAAYRSALEIDSDYARPQVGLASVRFQQSHHGCKPETIDADGVEEAIELYRSAANAEGQTPGANIAVKVAFGTGLGYLCLSEAHLADAWGQAADGYRVVIDAHENGELHDDELAAEAWSGLGLAEMYDEPVDDEDFERAVDAFEKAIDLSTQEERQAAWFGYEGFAHCKLGNTEASLAAYDRAIALASDQSAVSDYQVRSTRASSSNVDDC